MWDGHKVVATQIKRKSNEEVYLTSSDSPVRRSDIEELKKLLESGKPTLIAVTKFDRIEEDFDLETDELIQERKPKPESSRREQLQWVETQVQEAGLDAILQDRQYSFLSTYLAADAVKRGDEQAFEDSGLP